LLEWLDRLLINSFSPSFRRRPESRGLCNPSFFLVSGLRRNDERARTALRNHFVNRLLREEEHVF